MSTTKQQQDQDRDEAAALAAFELVRPGLATEDRVDVGELRPDDLGQQMASIAAGDVPSASPAEIKRAKLQLPSWKRQEEVLRGYEALGNLTAACEGAGVARRTADHWRLKDALGFAARLEFARGGFGDRLEALAWDMVKRMKPGQNPTLLICLLNATLPLKYRPAVQVDPVAARDTLSELRQLASAGAATEGPIEDPGAAAVAEAERLLGSRTRARTVPTPGNTGETMADGGDDGVDQGQPHRGPGPDGREMDPSGDD